MKVLADITENAGAATCLAGLLLMAFILIAIFYWDDMDDWMT
jgi:hypothetical protein